jgi:hypothetical protein
VDTAVGALALTHASGSIADIVNELLDGIEHLIEGEVMLLRLEEWVHIACMTARSDLVQHEATGCASADEQGQAALDSDDSRGHEGEDDLPDLPECMGVWYNDSVEIDEYDQGNRTTPFEGESSTEPAAVEAGDFKHSEVDKALDMQTTNGRRTRKQRKAAAAKKPAADTSEHVKVEAATIPEYSAGDRVVGKFGNGTALVGYVTGERFSDDEGHQEVELSMQSKSGRVSMLWLSMRNGFILDGMDLPVMHWCAASCE